MSQNNTNRDAAWESTLTAAWTALPEDSLDDIQIEILAAYAEGRLSDDNSRECEDLLSRNPAALRLVEELWQSAEVTTGHSVSLTTSVNRPSRPFLIPWILQMACAFVGIVGLAFALLTSYQSRQMRAQVAALEDRWAESQLELGVLHKEYLLAESVTPVRGFWTGTITPKMLLVGHVRGVGQPGPDGLANAERARQAFAPLHDTQRFTGRAALELASVEIAAGRLEVAEKRLDEARRILGDSADVQNTQAMWLLAKGEHASADEAERVLQSLVRAHPDFVPGRFNLALLLQQQFRNDESRAMWQEYLKRERRYEYRRVAERSLTELDP